MESAVKVLVSIGMVEAPKPLLKSACQNEGRQACRGWRTGAKSKTSASEDAHLQTRHNGKVWAQKIRIVLADGPLFAFQDANPGRRFGCDTHKIAIHWDIGNPSTSAAITPA